MRKLKLHSLHDDGHALLYQLLDVCTEEVTMLKDL